MFSMRVEYDLKDVTIPRKILRTLESIPESVWNVPRRIITNAFAERARRITRFSVSKGTQAWRKSAAKRGISVPTYIGSRAHVLSGSRVGRRTGTFIKDYREARPPTVTMEVSDGPYKVRNGTFTYEIHPEAYDREYPERFFEPYLVDRGIIPPDGLAALEDIEIDQIFDYLEEEIAGIAEKALLE